ncbi:helix-turn-helix domain-containing protein [Enterovirga sp.]|uniref:AraC family transcriptional regulator n=1 Tax=Enterovirga sp. TaxID=2026350 RepID=UPI002B88418E|nr:helix-turn-helix domain-containing protein [Enterovirga sp.]HMO27863.1 helix-turn-helix domain-containing protein [Enterovirga sp.]
MSGIPLTRCQFLIPFVGILKDAGSSPDPILKKFRLPVSLEEKAHHYIPILPAISFAEAARRSQGVVDFGFQAARQLQFSHLSERLRVLVSHSPTLFTALRQTCKWSSTENTSLSMWLEPCGDQIRICSRLIGAEGLPHLEHSQWLQLVFTIHIVRHFVGPHWSPATIAFEARYAPALETQSLWPHSRFLSGQHASWIDVPVSHLSLPAPPTELPAPSNADGDGPSGYEIAELVRLMLPAYLDEGLPTLDEVADMAGLSARSFQRRLSLFGLSYSDLVSAARFENARKLLRDTDAKVIEVAFASGYTDHAHFTRAFRRMAGVTPRHFRQQSRQQD